MPRQAPQTGGEVPAHTDFDTIYEEHADAYDELVGHEDHRGALGEFLVQAVSWAGARVIEAGIGTGRVTQIYADDAGEILGTDRSPHMLARARANLAAHGGKVRLEQWDNLRLGELADGPEFRAVDVFIEGWAFGHQILEHPEDVAGTTAELVAATRRLVAPGGTIILIETLGTAVAEPGAPDGLLGRFYELLQTEHGFTKHVLATDYAFPSLASAVTVMGFFFGPELAARVAAEGSPIVAEFTGVWIARRP